METPSASGASEGQREPTLHLPRETRRLQEPAAQPWGELTLLLTLPSHPAHLRGQASCFLSLDAASPLPPGEQETASKGGACAQEAAGLEVSPRGFAAHARGKRWAGRARVRLRGFSGARRLLCPQGPLGACACPLLTLSRSRPRYPLPHGASKCCQLLGLAWAGQACSLQPNRRLLGEAWVGGLCTGSPRPSWVLGEFVGPSLGCQKRLLSRRGTYGTET